MTDYFDELPSDPEAAFIFLEARFRSDLEHIFPSDVSDFNLQTYISQTLGAADALGIEALSAHQEIPIDQIECTPLSSIQLRNSSLSFIFEVARTNAY